MGFTKLEAVTCRESETKVWAAQSEVANAEKQMDLLFTRAEERAEGKAETGKAYKLALQCRELKIRLLTAQLELISIADDCKALTT